MQKLGFEPNCSIRKGTIVWSTISFFHIFLTSHVRFNLNQMHILGLMKTLCPEIDGECCTGLYFPLLCATGSKRVFEALTWLQKAKLPNGICSHGNALNKDKPAVVFYIYNWLPLQHWILVIVDASSDCTQANFNIGGLTTTSRKWSIRVTQYACGDYDMSGWPGCLQYYTSTASTIQKYV